MNLEGHVAPQVLELHGVVVLGVVPRHLVHLDVVALVTLVLVVVVVAVLVLARMQLVFGVVDARESRCRVEDCGCLDDLGTRHDEEYSTLVYLSRRWCSRSVDLSGSVLKMKKWKDAGSSLRCGSHPFLHHSLAFEH